MATLHDRDGDELVASFDRLAAHLDHADVPAPLAEELQRFGQSLRHQVRAAELELTRYEFLFEAAPDPYVVTDAHGVITEVNAAARSFLAIDTETAPRTSLVDFIAPAERDRCRGWLKNLRAGAPEARWDTALVASDESRSIPVEIHLADDLDGVGYRWLLRDQRERAAAERQLEAVAERAHHAAADLRAEARLNTQFLRSLSHDLRGPIGALIHQSELLTSDGLRPDIRERSHAALQENATTLHQILEALVDVERYSAGELTLQLEPVPIARILDRLRRPDDGDFRVAATGDGIVVDADLEILLRALQTVVDAMRTSGGADLTIEAAADDGMVELTVRVPRPHSLEEGRLDLRLARTMIERHGGSLRHSDEGGRQTAVVSLPVSDRTRA